MRVAELRPIIVAALYAMPRHEDELRELDAALGDGDLGITVRAGATAVAAVIEEAQPADAGALLLLAGRAFAGANPSTFAALIGGALMAAAAEVGAAIELDAAATERMTAAAAVRIQARGKAELGDKTVVDLLVPMAAVLGAAAQSTSATRTPAEVAREVAAWARQRVVETSAWQSQRGRAAWQGDRSIGKPDAGSAAIAIFVEELARAWA